MANNNQIYKMSNAGGFKSLNRYYDMLAGNITWNPWSPAGAYDALATVTVPSGGAVSISFAGIPTGYKHLQVRVSARGTGNDTYFNTRFNSDTAANYSWHQLFGDGSSAGAGAGSSATGMVGVQFTDTASVFNAGIIDILDYASTNKAKTVRSLSGFDANGSGKVILRSGAWYKNTSSVYDAVTSITLTPATGTIEQYSTFSLYGVK